MTLHLRYLVLAAGFSLVAAGLFAMMRFEQRSGQGFLLLWKPASWTRDAQPSLFKARMASYWLGIFVFSLAALADFAAFFGIIR